MAAGTKALYGVNFMTVHSPGLTWLPPLPGAQPSEPQELMLTFGIEIFHADRLTILTSLIMGKVML